MPAQNYSWIFEKLAIFIQSYKSVQIRKKMILARLELKYDSSKSASPGGLARFRKSLTKMRLGQVEFAQVSSKYSSVKGPSHYGKSAKKSACRTTSSYLVRMLRLKVHHRGDLHVLANLKKCDYDE